MQACCPWVRMMSTLRSRRRKGGGTWGRIWPSFMMPLPTRGRVYCTVSDWSPLEKESMMAMKPPPAPATTVRQGGVTSGLSSRAVVADWKRVVPTESCTTRLQSWAARAPHPCFRYAGGN